MNPVYNRSLLLKCFDTSAKHHVLKGRFTFVDYLIDLMTDFKLLQAYRSINPLR